MFTTGKLIFTAIFVLVFITALIYAYRKDIKLHKKYYPGTVWVLIAFIAFILFIVALKFIFT